MNTKYKAVKRNVKHIFTPEETTNLNLDFRRSYDSLKSVEAEFDSVKASYKAKTTEAESRMETIASQLNAGFEFRDKQMVVVMDMKLGKKYFHLESDLVEGELPATSVPIITEPVTDADRQQELIEAEAKFEKRETIELFKPAEKDKGSVTLGLFDGKWFSALNVQVGGKSIIERLDSEQPCSKKRYDQLKRAIKKFQDWLVEVRGREEAKGFNNFLELVKAEHTEREE